MSFVSLLTIQPNPENPRTCKKDKFEKLKASIVQDPEFMPLRPIVVDENWMILGGNHRYKACMALGIEEVPEAWIKQVKGWSDEKKRAFIIKDNVSNADWDWEALANEWEESELEAWGLDLPDLEAIEEQDGPSEEAKPKLTIEFEAFDDLEAFYHEIEGILEGYEGARVTKGII